MKLLILFLIAFSVLGCLNSEPPPPPGQQIDTSSETKESISQETTNEFVNDTGIVIDDITIAPKGTLGGDVIINVTNSASEACAGLAINVDVLTESKSVVASMGLKYNSRGGIPPSGKQTLKEMFIGSGAKEVVVTEITCDAACTMAQAYCP
jgi:hypothetical protein